VPADVSKRGVDGNQLMGTLSSRHKRAVGIIACFDFRIEKIDEKEMKTGCFSKRR